MPVSARDQDELCRELAKRLSAPEKRRKKPPVTKVEINGDLQNYVKSFNPDQGLGAEREIELGTSALKLNQEILLSLATSPIMISLLEFWKNRVEYKKSHLTKIVLGAKSESENYPFLRERFLQTVNQMSETFIRFNKSEGVERERLKSELEKAMKNLFDLPLSNAFMHVHLLESYFGLREKMMSLSNGSDTKVLDSEMQKIQRPYEELQKLINYFVEHNLALVVPFAKKFDGRLELIDLIQMGNMGLRRGVQGFDPRLENRFSTYASRWIKQAMSRAYSRLSPANRMIFDKRPLSLNYTNHNGTEFGESLEAVDMNFNTFFRSSEKDRDAFRSKIILDGIEILKSERKQGEDVQGPYSSFNTVGHPYAEYILTHRYGLDGLPSKTLEELGAELGVTREQVRKVLRWSFQQIKVFTILKSYQFPPAQKFLLREIYGIYRENVKVNFKRISKDLMARGAPSPDPEILEQIHKDAMNFVDAQFKENLEVGIRKALPTAKKKKSAKSVSEGGDITSAD
ncbi:MAG: sigma-70 family RNA polymerase sigma factor [Deltaproteobacteria bacterium]|nr:sigma-70 family RNA polymerase sigma factor [Deltaproteobacteria bacterium]